MKLQFPRFLRLLAAAALVGLAGLAPEAATAKTLTGQVVCSQCWFESDRTVTAYGTPDDLECAGRCAAQGVDAALATRDGDAFTLYLLKGPPPGGGRWVDWAGAYVTAEGEVLRGGKGSGGGKGGDDGKDRPRLRIARVERLAASPWPLAAAPEGGDHEEAAPLSWTDLRGNPVAVDAFRGRVTVINFWATWCLPCKQEMPDLIDLHDRFAPYGVEFVGATADAADQVEGVLTFVRKQKMNFPVVLGATTRQMERLGLPPALPATVILDEHGHAVDRFPGVIDPRQVEASLERLLGLTASGPPGKVARVARARPDTHGKQSHASLVPS